MSELLDQIEARAEDARRNREMYGKESRSRRITNEESAKDVPRLLAAVRAVEDVTAEMRLRVSETPCGRGCEGCTTGEWEHAIRLALTEALEGE